MVYLAGVYMLSYSVMLFKDLSFGIVDHTLIGSLQSWVSFHFLLLGFFSSFLKTAIHQAHDLEGVLVGSLIEAFVHSFSVR